MMKIQNELTPTCRKGGLERFREISGGKIELIDAKPYPTFYTKRSVS